MVDSIMPNKDLSLDMRPIRRNPDIGDDNDPDARNLADGYEAVLN